MTDRTPISAGSAERDSDPADMFPPLDIWAARSPRRDVADYGRNAGKVATVVRRASSLDPLDVERVGSVFGHGNADHAAAAADANRLRSAIRIAAAVTGRKQAVRDAYLDGQLAVLLACNPVVGALEFWWNSYPEVPAMEAAGLAAAAAVVTDALDPDTLLLARRPFVALDDGLPPGLFGPRHADVAAIIDAVAGLSEAQARRVVRAWERPPTGDLHHFGYWGPLHSERGLDGWMPPEKGRRHLAWISLLTGTDPDSRGARRFAWATVSAGHRSRFSAGSEALWHDDQPGNADVAYLNGAVEAAVAATLLADLVPADLVAELTEAWRSRDGDVEPSGWSGTRLCVKDGW